MAGEASKAIDPKILWGGGRSPFSMSYGKMMMWFFIVSDALTFGGLIIAMGFARYKYSGDWPIAQEVFDAMPFLSGSYPLLYVALMTFVLIASSLTMVLAVEAGKRMDRTSVIKWLASTVILGALFLSAQAWEWSHFIKGTEGGRILLENNTWAYVGEDVTTLRLLEDSELGAKRTVITGEQAEALRNNAIYTIKGANMIENEYGVRQYGSYFFVITGFHGFHVFTGFVLNIIVLTMVVRNVMHRRGHYEMVDKAGLYWHFVDLVWVFVFTFLYIV
ncbi:MAG: cytochrome c oxidase subunit 3 [Luteibaculaceae bacterium]